jgi:hypothetical protein
MTRTWFVGICVAAAFSSTSAKGGSVALTATPIDVAYDEGFGATMGFSFTTNQPITIDALADWNPAVNGSQVRLYDGSQRIIAETTITTNDPTTGYVNSLGAGPDTFSIQTIQPVTLAANSTYYIATDVLAFNRYLCNFSDILTDSSISYGGGVFAFATGQTPLTDESRGNLEPGFFGPNFVIGTSSVPEPSSIVLSLIAVAIGTICAGRTRPIRERSETTR